MKASDKMQPPGHAGECRRGPSNTEGRRAMQRTNSDVRACLKSWAVISPMGTSDGRG
jgi:hypothetical protein